MKKHVMKKWVKALRSGKYKQGVYALQFGDEFCCLGVLCKISPKSVVKHLNYITSEIAGDDLDSQLDVMKWADLKSSWGNVIVEGISRSLTSLNDNRISFEEIADIIEKNWEKL